MLLINNKYGYENWAVSANQNEKWVICRVFIAQCTVRSAGSSAGCKVWQQQEGRACDSSPSHTSSVSVYCWQQTKQNPVTLHDAQEEEENVFSYCIYSKLNKFLVEQVSHLFWLPAQWTLNEGKTDCLEKWPATAVTVIHSSHSTIKCQENSATYLWHSAEELTLLIKYNLSYSPTLVSVFHPLFHFAFHWNCQWLFISDRKLSVITALSSK